MRALGFGLVLAPEEDPVGDAGGFADRPGFLVVDLRADELVGSFAMMRVGEGERLVVPVRGDVKAGEPSRRLSGDRLTTQLLRITSTLRSAGRLNAW